MTRTDPKDRQVQPVDMFRSDGTDVWQEGDEQARVRGLFPLTPGLSYASKVASTDFVLVCIEIDPDHYLPIHQDDTEELLLVTTGSIEATVGEELVVLGAEECTVIPENVPHRLRNNGNDVAHVISFFPDTELSATFEEPLMPFGDTVTIPPEIDDK